MTGYRLWCPDLKSPKFVINKDVTFDENYMFQLRNESIVNSTGPGEEQASRWSLRAKLLECKRAHTLNQSMILKVQLQVMIHLKSNSTVLSLGEQEGKST